MSLFPQAPTAVVMIRPHHFAPNEQTRQDNSFQSIAPFDRNLVATQAYEQVTTMAKTLESHGVTVHLFEDATDRTPDSVFPNNWFSTHLGGQIAIYPMYAPNRRNERRSDIIDLLKAQYRVQDVIDYSGLEYDNIFLEGTGAMVLDHVERVAYAARSNRTDSHVLERFCTQFNIEPMVFDAKDEQGTDIYHTNVLMCVATDIVFMGLEMVTSGSRRAELINRFRESNRKVIELTPDQIASFAGNMLEVQGQQGPLLALPQCAYDSLTKDQIKQIEKHLRLLPLPIPTIEKAGGSIRCMLAGIHLTAR